MRNTVLWLVALLASSTLLGRSSSPAAPALSPAAEKTQRYGEYRVTQRIQSDGYQQCEILHKGRSVFFNGSRFTTVSELRNLTGHGRCNLAIHLTGGASGEGYQIVELGPRFQTVATLRGHVGNRFHWRDVDGDGQEELLLCALFLYNTVGVPVIQRWTGAGYETAYDLMREPAPSFDDTPKVSGLSGSPDKGLEALGDSIPGPSRQAFIDLTGAYLRAAASGHPDLAAQYLRAAGLTESERETFRKAARVSLAMSRYLSALANKL